MARKKSLESIDSEINKIQDELLKVQERADQLSARLLELKAQKREREMDQIMAAYMDSHKSLAEVLTFLEG